MSSHQTSADNASLVTLDCADHQVNVRSGPGDSIVNVPVADSGSVDDPRSWVAALEVLADQPKFIAEVAEGASLWVRASEVGMVCLDGDGISIYPVLWAHDQRSVDDALWCRKKFDDGWWSAEVGFIPQAHHLVTKMSWLHRRETEVWKSIRHICSLEDYVIASLLSEKSTLAIYSRPDLVTQFGIWSAPTNTYSSSVLSLIDQEWDWTKVLPEVCAVGSSLGTWRNWKICR